MNSLLLLLTLLFSLTAAIYVCMRMSSRWVIGDIETIHKHSTIDGIRGIAAILVVFHHSIMTFNNIVSGNWGNNAQELNSLSERAKIALENAGPLAVSIFFMITGFLFFERIISKNNFGDVLWFYKKRALRIIPMYLVSIAVIFGCFITLGINNNINLVSFIKNLVGWLSFGFLPYTGMTDHFQYGRINAGVIWTLTIEWKFYALLPLMASILLMFKHKLVPLIVFAIALHLSFYYGLVFRMNASIVMCFVVGAIAASLSQYSLVRFILSHYIIAIMCILSISFVALRNDVFYSLDTIGYLALFFIPVACGNSIFGLMKLQILKMVGLISYSIYLMHGVILNIVYLTFSKLGYMTSTIIALILIALTCTFSYIYIEKRYMNSKINNYKVEKTLKYE